MYILRLKKNLVGNQLFFCSIKSLFKQDLGHLIPGYPGSWSKTSCLRSWTAWSPAIFVSALTDSTEYSLNKLHAMAASIMLNWLIQSWQDWAIRVLWLSLTVQWLPSPLTPTQSWKALLVHFSYPWGEHHPTFPTTLVLHLLWWSCPLPF